MVVDIFYFKPIWGKKKKYIISEEDGDRVSVNYITVEIISKKENISQHSLDVLNR